VKTCSVCAAELVSRRHAKGMCIRCYDRVKKRDLRSRGICVSCRSAPHVVGRGGLCAPCADRNLACTAKRRKQLADLGLPNPKNISNAARKARAREQGLCTSCCFCNAVLGKTQCVECAAQSSRRTTDKYKFRKENGLCWDCAQPTEIGLSRCRACLDKVGARNRVRKQSKKEA
jgi:hypothetical protein